jgi:thiol:disulfide interchange protein DsbD
MNAFLDQDQPFRASARRVWALLLVALIGLASGARAEPEEVPASARGAGALFEERPRVHATLLVDVTAAAVEIPFRVGVLFELDRGWHMYWRNPGDSGLPTELRWELEGAEVGPLAWPVPEVFREAEGTLTTYGYRDRVLLAQPARLRAGSGRAPRQVRVEADFLVCRVQCVPGRIEVVRTLPVAAAPATADARTRALFDRFAARVPRPLALEPGLDVQVFYSQSAIRPGDEFRAALAIAPHTFGTDPAHDAFVPDSIESLSIHATGARAHPFAPRGTLLTLAGRASAKDPGSDQRLRGVLTLRDPGGERRFVEIDLPLPRARAGAAIERIDNAWLDPGEEPAPELALTRAIGLALLGGLLLNLMPCVLPVLAIKALGVAELSRRSPRERLAQGAAYGAGVLASLLALAAVVAALRAAGARVGWGFQFQEPLFVAAISALLVLFALNLFGVFEFSLDATRLARAGEGSTGARRSFFEGLLAVALATPCSAPFLGSAVGFAFASTTPVIFGIFAAIGVGLAAPYVAVTVSPAAARFIPRAGPWMLHVRSALGFALLATVVWLVWVMGRATSVEGMAVLLAFLVAVAGIAWLYGALQAAGRPQGALVALVALGLAGLGLGLAELPLVPDRAEAPVAGASLAALPFDRERVQASLAEGRPVFVYFTADWCLTCKVTERLVLADGRVQAELHRLGVAAFKADWTRRDETIRAELESLGKAGVPAYVVYSPEAPTVPRVLPELLTVDALIGALRDAAPQAGRVSSAGSVRTSLAFGSPRAGRLSSAG